MLLQGNTRTQVLFDVFTNSAQTVVGLFNLGFDHSAVCLKEREKGR